MTQTENLRVTHIYIFKAGSHQKVGRSDNPIKRLEALRSGNPFPMTLAALWLVRSSDAGHIEQTCFNKFRTFSEFPISGPYRVSEWYKEEAPIMDFLISILGNPIPSEPPKPRVWNVPFGPKELFLHLDGPFFENAHLERLADIDEAEKQVSYGMSYPRSFFIPGRRGDYWFEVYKSALDEKNKRAIANYAGRSFA